MQFLMMVLSHPDRERDPIVPEEMAEMGEYNDALRKAGLLLSVAGLHPSATGARVDFQDGRTSVTDGPFTESKELVAGFWLLQAESREEVIAWARRVPFRNGRVEIRRVAEGSDTGYETAPPGTRARAGQAEPRDDEERSEK